MGRVYLGRTPAGSAVAVKLVHREFANDRAFRRRFEQEVAAARRVQGLYTVPVVDADLRADEPWLATAYVPGPSLHDAVADHGPLPVETAVSLIARVAEALQSVHSAGVIHRDLKPSNIILSAEGPKVIDFGIARAADVTSVTGTGVLAGTPAYMAPEYIRGQTVTEAVDVFALGVIAVFAATGAPAFGTGSGHSVMYRILEQDPDLDGCPEPVRSIAAGCLEKDPRRRSGLAEIIRRCRPDPVADGPGHTELSPPRARTVVDGAALLHDAATAAAADGAVRAGPGPQEGERASAPAGPPPAVTAVTPLPMVLTGAAVLAVIVLLVVLLPGGSDQPPTPSERTPLAALADFPGESGGVAFSPDGRTIAAGSGDGTVVLWDTATRKRRATLTQHHKPDKSEGSTTSGRSGKSPVSITCVAFSPDGRLLAAGTGEGGVGVWNVADHRQVADTPGDSLRTMERVTFSPDGRTLAAASDDGVLMWDVEAGKGLGKQRATLFPDEWVEQVAFSPDGRTLAVAPYSDYSDTDPDPAHLWDVAGRRTREELTHSKGLMGVAFSPDGKTLATTDEDEFVRLWNPANGSLERSFAGGKVTDHRGVAFSPDGKTLAVISGEHVGLWDRDHLDTERTVLVGNTENTASVVFSPDGRLVATAAYDGTVRLWRTQES